MNIGDKFIIKTKNLIEKGFAPVGSILEIVEIKKDCLLVTITPYVTRENIRDSLTIKTTRDFIESCSTKIN